MILISTKRGIPLDNSSIFPPSTSKMFHKYLHILAFVAFTKRCSKFIRAKPPIHASNLYFPHLSLPKSLSGFKSFRGFIEGFRRDIRDFIRRFSATCYCFDHQSNMNSPLMELPSQSYGEAYKLIGTSFITK